MVNQSGERVRVLMGSGRNCWRYLTIADLRAHPPYLVSGRASPYNPTSLIWINTDPRGLLLSGAHTDDASCDIVH